MYVREWISFPELFCIVSRLPLVTTFFMNCDKMVCARKKRKSQPEICECRKDSPAADTVTHSVRYFLFRLALGFVLNVHMRD